MRATVLVVTLFSAACAEQPQPGCRSTGQPCALSGDCCSWLVCQFGACTAPSTCRSRGSTCASTADCCPGLVCPRYGATCALGALGDPCRTDDDCASAWCLGYCTMPCSSHGQCGGTNYCLETTQGFLCVPFCSSYSDCLVYGASCATSTDPDGLPLSGCFS